MLKKFKSPLTIAFFACTVLFLALVSSGCTATTTPAQASSSSDPKIIHLKTRIFALNTNTHIQPLLKLNGDVCQVQVQPGNNSHVVVQVTIQHYQKNPMPAIHYNQDNEANTLAIDEKLPLQADINGVNDSITINIIVPQRMDLDLNTKVGNLAVADVNGQLVLATSTGNITVVNTQLTRRSSLTANVGNVFFAGVLMPQGTYSMDARVGRVDLAFQRPPSLQITAQTMIGSIHSDFPGLTVNGNVAQGTLGKPPYGHLSLTTRIGSISVLS